MNNIVNNDRMTKIISVVLAVVFGVLLISLVVNAATTISGTTITLENAEVISNATDGVIQLGGIASSTSVTLLNGETITNATDGTITFTTTNTVLVGTASSSAIRVGTVSSPTIGGLSFGYCTFSTTAVTASSTEYFDCTTTPTTALVSGDRVFIQATSSFDTGFVIEAASSTGVSTINVRVRNISGVLGTPDTSLGGTSLNFWAVR